MKNPRAPKGRVVKDLASGAKTYLRTGSKADQIAKNTSASLIDPDAPKGSALKGKTFGASTGAAIAAKTYDKKSRIKDIGADQVLEISKEHRKRGKK